ncbi:MAG: hypothetical protein AB8A71_03855 [Prochlorococcus sp.]
MSLKAYLLVMDNIRSIQFIIATLPVAFTLLSPIPALASICSGRIVAHPVIIFRDGEALDSSYYKKGMNVYFIDKILVNSPIGKLYCSWDGNCFSERSLKLDYILEVRGDISEMSTSEVERETYQTLDKCSDADLSKTNSY